MPQNSTYGYVSAAAVVFFVVGWIVHRWRVERATGAAQGASAGIIAAAEREARTVRKEAELAAKEEQVLTSQKLAREAETARSEQNRRLERLDQREVDLAKKVAYLDQKENRLDQQGEELKGKTATVDERQKELEQVIGQQNRRLEQVAGMTAEEARRELQDNMVAEARQAASRQIKQIRDESERTAKREAQKILSIAIQR